MDKMNDIVNRFCCRMSCLPEFLLSGIGLVLLFLLTLLPGEELPQAPEIPLIDKWSHLLAFGLVSTALLFDIGRFCGRLTWKLWFATGMAMTLLGAVVELLQGWMGLGRSADCMDGVADALGAFLLPLIFLPLLRRTIECYLCRLDSYAGDKSILPRVMDLYMMSFPPEERRDWDDLRAKACDPGKPLSLTVVRSRRRFAGFITYWDLGGVRYVEHFAIDPALRGTAIGARAIKKFTANASTPVVLEVEPASDGEMARRRIGFYQRCGFQPHPDFEYLQPPYAPGLPELPLMLMTRGSVPDLHGVSEAIRTQVYGVHL